MALAHLGYETETGQISIGRLNQQFQKWLTQTAIRIPNYSVVHRGRTLFMDVYWNEEFGYWVGNRESTHRSNNAFMNLFGIGDPKKNRPLSILLEVNFGFDGSDRRTGGAFIKDDDGAFHIAHRGNFHGGKKKFWKYYTGTQVTTLTGAKLEEVAYIGPLGETIVRDVAKFISEVQKVKSIVDSPVRAQD